MSTPATRRNLCRSMVIGSVAAMTGRTAAARPASAGPDDELIRLTAAPMSPVTPRHEGCLLKQPSARDVTLKAQDELDALSRILRAFTSSDANDIPCRWLADQVRRISKDLDGVTEGGR